MNVVVWLDFEIITISSFCPLTAEPQRFPFLEMTPIIYVFPFNNPVWGQTPSIKNKPFQELSGIRATVSRDLRAFCQN